MEIDGQSSNEAEVVARQLEAYNARDIDAFMACWSAEAEIFAWPSLLIASGGPEIRARHVERFREPDLHAVLISRLGVAGLVVDRERVTRNLPEGLCTLEVLGIYEVVSGRIRRAWFKQGDPGFVASAPVTTER
ncbi:nuclear transport factor 2 family protein [Sphingomonas sp.]|jgi:putative hydrolase of HD superfamily|uniref:nuclear transport factor 2 family protein n=1 Tax=Sphingomonas sp. TaxID=28214 RepID=UPI002DF58EA9|nr:nuclear transport factor 2 family protein [Sphingomonas sp.]